MSVRARENVKILLVDDSAQNLLTLRAILNDCGYHLVQASSGPQALKRLLEDEFAVVLLDVVMPIMDGFETAKLIRSRPKTRHLPIIFISAMNTDEASVYSGYSVGAVDYISTPIIPDILRAKVAVFVDLFLKTEEIRRQSEILRAMERERYEKELLATRQQHEIETLRLKEEHLERERQLEAENGQRLALQAAQLERSNQELERFAHVVSHDLQEPLNTVSLYCQLLERKLEKKLDDREMEYLRYIVSGSNRMKSLITGLLNYSQLKGDGGGKTPRSSTSTSCSGKWSAG